MVVTYYGEGCFRLQSGETSLLVDPANARLKADIVLRTLTPLDTVAGHGVIPAGEIVGPGEYEIKDIEILGWQVAGESGEKFLKTIYLVTWEDINAVFLGHLSQPPSEDVLEQIQECDLLFLPASGGHFLDPQAAAKLVRQLEPTFAIPSFLKNPKDFLSALGQKAEPQEKLVFKKKDLEDGKSQAVILTAN